MDADPIDYLLYLYRTTVANERTQKSNVHTTRLHSKGIPSMHVSVDYSYSSYDYKYYPMPGAVPTLLIDKQLVYKAMCIARLLGKEVDEIDYLLAK
jgi:hypothetical protein